MSNGDGNGGLTKYLKGIGVFLGVILSGLTLLWGFDVIYATDGDVQKNKTEIAHLETAVAQNMQQIMNYVDQKSAVQEMQLDSLKKSNRVEELNRRYTFNIDLMYQLEALMIKNPSDGGLKMKYERIKATVLELEKEIRALNN